MPRLIHVLYRTVPSGSGVLPANAEALIDPMRILYVLYYLTFT